MANMEEAQEKPSRRASQVLPADVQQADVQSGQFEAPAYEPIAGAEVVEELHSLLGNEIVMDALASEELDPLSSMVGGELSESIVGQGGGSGAFSSNTAMLRVMRDATIDWEDPSLKQLNHPTGGHALPKERLERFNEAFSHDFSHVRIHTDSSAARAAEVLHAHAFALGSHIFFGQGTYGGGRDTDRLLAHELTHVVQSDEGRLPNASEEGVSSPTDPSEQEAYANEVRIMSKLDAIDAGDTLEGDTLEEQATESAVVESDLEPQGSESESAEAPSFESWSGFGGEAAIEEGGEDESGDSVDFGGLAMRKKDGLTETKTSDERVLKLIRQSRGAPIPEAVAERMGRAMGEDVSHAKVHTDVFAAQAAELLNAKAFALGADVFFGEGEYAPGTPEGDKLFAHELAHVVQHDAGKLPTRSSDGLQVSDPNEAAELEADAVATEAVRAVDAPEVGEDLSANTETATTESSTEGLAAMRQVGGEEGGMGDEEPWKPLTSNVVYFPNADGVLTPSGQAAIDAIVGQVQGDKSQQLGAKYKLSISARAIGDEADDGEDISILTASVESTLKTALSDVEAEYNVGVVESGDMETMSQENPAEDSAQDGEPQFAVYISVQSKEQDEEGNDPKALKGD